MAKNLQEALHEVQDDLKRLGLEIKGDRGSKGGPRKRRRKPPAAALTSSEQHPQNTRHSR